MPLALPDRATSRAVFVGTSAYQKSTGLAPLENVENSVRRLRQILCDDKQGVFDPHLTQVPLLNPATGGDILQAIMSAAEGATDVLLVYYAGHAVSGWVSGKEHLYLVPSDAKGRGSTLAAGGLDFELLREELRRAPARRRILILDCCYSGIATTGTLAGPEQLTPEQVGDLIRDDSWHIVTSSAAERTAQDSDGHGYTAFTGALIQCLESGGEPSTVGEEPEHLGIETLYHYAQRRLPGQAPQLLRNGASDVALGRNPRRPAEEYAQWAERATAFLDACGLSGSGRPEPEALVKSAVDRLARCWPDDRRAATDPWRSPQVAGRMSKHLQDMVVQSPGKDARLSEAEYALLTLMPFVYAAWWDGAVIESLKTADPWESVLGGYGEAAEMPADYRDFLARHPDHVRRAMSALQRRNEPAARAIAWWLHREWVLEQALIGRQLDPLLDKIVHCLEPGGTGPLSELLGLREPLREVLDDLLRALLTAPDPRLKLDTLNRGRDKEIRAGLLARLLTVALQMAIDPFTVSTAVDHVNGGNDFTPERLRGNYWDWQPLTTSKSGSVVYDLYAHCESPEVAAVLRAHCAALDRYVLQAMTADKDAVGVAALRQIVPLRFGSLDVLPAKDSHGRPRFSLTEMRLTLDDDRIRQLLMGTQIYQDPAVAIREMFQNALDACRYRERRIRYHALKEAPGSPGSVWRGRITFTAGDENGRPYIDCSDNGVGMGEEEVEKLFARGGTRFAMSQEYLAERADWEKAGISMESNSAFGIGVYSYFLLADEIRVVTRRVERNGRTGRGLRIDISGPGALFHITDTEELPEGGTSVRLYLKPDIAKPSCAEVLRTWVCTSDYDLEAAGSRAADSFRLRAGQLHIPGAPGHTRKVPTGVPADVWWCDGEGGVLRDGIWINYPIFGAVVNLTGAKAPDLTLDRSRPRYPDTIDVDEVLADRVDALIRSPESVVSPAWLAELAHHRPALANTVTQAAITAGFPHWSLDGRNADIGVVGCFPPEIDTLEDQYGDLLRARPKDIPRPGRALRGGSRTYTLSGRVLRELEAESAQVADWRARTWTKAGLIEGARLDEAQSPPVALPGDALLMDLGRSSPKYPLRDSSGQEQDSLGRARYMREAEKLIAASLKLGISYTDARARLRHLGEDDSQLPDLPAAAERNDPFLVSTDLDGEPPWLQAGAEVSIDHILRAATVVGLEPWAAAARLAELGHPPCDADHPLLRLAHGSTDLTFISQYLTGQPPWLDVTAPVPLAHVLGAAVAAHAPARDTVHRLTQLGYTVPRLDHPALLAALHPDDPLLLSRDLDGQPPWLDAARPVPMAHLLFAADKLGREPGDVRARLTELGLSVPDRDSVSSAALLADDRIVISRDLNGKAPWLDAATPVSLSHIVRAAATTRTTARDVVHRLTELGYTVRDPGHRAFPATSHPENDRRLISRDRDGRAPWLDAAAPVSLSHIAKAAAATRTTAGEVVDRLTHLGYTVQDVVSPALLVDLRSNDPTLLSRDLDARDPWLDISLPVPRAHVLRAAAATGASAEHTAQRLAQLGYTLQSAGSPALPTEFRRDDPILLSWDLDGLAPWLTTNEPIPIGRVHMAARRLGWTPAQVAECYAELGFDVPRPEDPSLRTPLNASDLLLLSKNREGTGSAGWFEPGDEVPFPHVLLVADLQKENLWQVADRARVLGLRLPQGIEFDRAE